MTLVEVLVALCILAVVAVIISSIYPLMLDRQTGLLYTQIAANEAQSELDRIAHWAAVDYDNLTKHISLSPCEVEGLPQGEKVVEVLEYPSSGCKYLKKVKVTIKWAGHGEHSSGQVTYVTMVTKPFKETTGISADI